MGCLYELSLFSAQSMHISLNAIASGKAGLDKRRRNILDRVSERGEYAYFGLESLEMNDLAYLTAYTGDEFAVLRGKKNDILFHGTPISCSFRGDLYNMLITGKVSLVGHSHPGEEIPTPSADDRLTLRRIGQNESKIISGLTGNMITFSADPFEKR